MLTAEKLEVMLREMKICGYSSCTDQVSGHPRKSCGEKIFDLTLFYRPKKGGSLHRICTYLPHSSIAISGSIDVQSDIGVGSVFLSNTPLATAGDYASSARLWTCKRVLKDEDFRSSTP